MTQFNASRTRLDPASWSPLDAVVSLARAWVRRRRFARLKDLEDFQLDDIGLSRDDIAWGKSLPLSVDATQAVRIRKLGRPDRSRPVNAVCPWTGRPVSSAATTKYRGHLVGFGSVDARHEFELARDAFDRAIAARTAT